MKKAKAKSLKINLFNATINLHTTPEKADKIQQVADHCAEKLRLMTSWEVMMLCELIEKYNLSRG